MIKRRINHEDSEAGYVEFLFLKEALGPRVLVLSCPLEWESSSNDPNAYITAFLAECSVAYLHSFDTVEPDTHYYRQARTLLAAWYSNIFNFSGNF